MLLKLIEDMKCALNANCYLAALSIALMIPDICGKAEYPTKGTGFRYKTWYNTYIGNLMKDPEDDYSDIAMPYLSGEVVYSLRNSFLHQGTPNVDKDKIQEDQNKLDSFELIIENRRPFDIYVDESSVLDDSKRIYRVNIRGFCTIIDFVATTYYENNMDKFNFFEYKVIDLRD